MKQKSLILSLLFFAAVASMHAQVTIGSTAAPTPGAVLDLSQVPSDKKLGMILPTVTLTGSTTYQLGTSATQALDTYPAGAGTVVFHVGSAALLAGFYVWDGNNWLAAGGTVQLPGTIEVGSNTYTTGYFGSAGWWMTENLREIPADVASPSSGSSNTTKYWNYAGGYSHQDSILKYGLLYSWAAAINSTVSTSVENRNNPDQAQIQGICPDGWHLPSDYEWSQLEEAIALNTTQAYSTIADATIIADNFYLYSTVLDRGSTPAASSLDKKMKANRIWSTPGASKAASEGGFCVLPAGAYNTNSSAQAFGTIAYFQTSSSSGSTASASTHILNSDSDLAGVIKIGTPKNFQYSVRCKKN
ncbi:hypothetical protein FACS1894176_11470 [Bacteroidia bacterium]|nr:hypothetical protein FACS1894176_11470 [Bacteroidia bacterium]